MSEETKAVEQPTETKQEETPVVEKAPEQTFTQAQLDNIIKSRLEAEKTKHQRQLDEQKKKDDESNHCVQASWQGPFLSAIHP